MRRMTAIIAVMILVLITGCGPARAVPSELPVSTVPQSTTEKIKIGVVLSKFDEMFLTQVRSALETELQQKATITFIDSDGSQNTQNEKLDQLIEKKYNVICVDLVESSASQNVLARCQQADIPVVFFNQPPADNVLTTWEKAYFVGAHANEAGAMMGRTLARWWRNNIDTADLNDDEAMQAVILTGPEDSKLSEEIITSCREALSAADISLSVIERESGDWDSVVAKEWMTKFIDTYKEDKKTKIEVVIAANDAMALGAIAALEANDYYKDHEPLPVVSAMATELGKYALAQGKLFSSVLNDPDLQGKVVAHLAYTLATGAPVNQETVGYEPTNQAIWLPLAVLEKQAPVEEDSSSAA